VLWHSSFGHLRPTYNRFSQPTNLKISTARFLFNLVTTHDIHLGHSCSSTYPLLFENHKSLLKVCCTLSMEWTPHRSPRASSDTVSCTFSYHTWQFHHLHHLHYHRLHLLLLAQCFTLQQIFFSIDLFLFYRGLITRTLGPSNDFTLLNGWICQCVRLSRLLVGFRMHFKSLHFHSFIHSFVLDMTYNVFGETLSLN